MMNHTKYQQYQHLNYGKNIDYVSSSYELEPTPYGISSLEQKQDPTLKSISNNTLLINDGDDSYDTKQSVEVSQVLYGINKSASFPNTTYNIPQQKHQSLEASQDSHGIIKSVSSPNIAYNKYQQQQASLKNNFMDKLINYPSSLEPLLGDMIKIIKNDKNKKLQILLLTKLFENNLERDQEFGELSNNINNINNKILIKLDNIENKLNDKILTKLDEVVININDEMNKKLNKMLNNKIPNKLEIENVDNKLVNIIEKNEKNNLIKLNLINKSCENNKLYLNELNGKIINKLDELSKNINIELKKTLNIKFDENQKKLIEFEKNIKKKINENSNGKIMLKFEEFENKINKKLEKLELLGFKLNLEHKSEQITNNKNNNKNKKNNNNNNNKKNNKLIINKKNDKKFEDYNKGLNELKKEVKVIISINNNNTLDIKDYVNKGVELLRKKINNAAEQIIAGMNKVHEIYMSKFNLIEKEMGESALSIAVGMQKIKDILKDTNNSLLTSEIIEKKVLTMDINEGILISPTIINKDKLKGDDIKNKDDILDNGVDINNVENLDNNIKENKENKILNIKKEDLKNMEDDELGDLILKFKFLEDIQNEILFRQILTERDKF